MRMRFTGTWARWMEVTVTGVKAPLDVGPSIRPWFSAISPATSVPLTTAAKQCLFESHKV